MKKRLLLFLFLLVVIVNVNANSAPVFNENKSSEIPIKEYESFNYQLNASDTDADELTFYDLASLVDFSSFKMNSSGYINFKVSHGDIGYYPVIIVVRDTSWVADVITFNFSVSESDKIVPSITNYAPGLEQSINENSTINFNVNSNYDSNDNIIFKWFLDGYEKSNDAHNFTYVSDYKSAGNHNVTFEINDTTISVSSYVTWNITVKNVNLVPYLIKPIENITIDQGREYDDYLNLNDYFDDADGDELNYSVNNISNIAVTISSDGMVTITTDEDFNGEKELVFSATDPAGNTIPSNKVNLIVNQISRNTFPDSSHENRDKKKQANEQTSSEESNKITGQTVNLPKENKIIETILEKVGFNNEMFKKPNISWGIIGSLIIIAILVGIWIKVRINRRKHFGF